MDSLGWDDLFSELLLGDESFNADGVGDGAVMAAQDGCHVEPDGVCPHELPSPARRLGLI